MKKVSSKFKGDILEDKVYDFVKGLISKDEFLANGKFCKIYKQKAYYSRDRQANIIVDISVEVTYPNTNDYSLLVIFECKNYQKTVSIDNIEEFANKLSQIAGHNVKGVMVTSSNYSSNGLNVARSRGIGLARLPENGSLTYDVYRKSKNIDVNKKSMEYVLCNESNSNIFLGLYDCDISYSFVDFLKSLNIIDTIPETKKMTVPFLETHAIKSKAEQVLKGYSPNVFEVIQETPLFDIHAKISGQEMVEFIFDKELGYIDGREILGKIVFNPTIIYVSPMLKKDIHRWRFTLAHELGHYFLHAQSISKSTDCNIDTWQSINAEIIDKNIKRMELQANFFASNILMPELAFQALVGQLFLNDKIKGGVLFLDNQYCNVNTYYRTVNKISSYFNVSKESAKYRLKELGFLEIRTSLHVIRDFL